MVNWVLKTFLFFFLIFRSLLPFRFGCFAFVFLFVCETTPTVLLEP